jgi:formimidoylglutamate deiminase
MTRLHFASALLPSGWANDVQMVITAGAIAEVTPGVAPAAGDERHGIALPGLASLHSHAFQRGMAGLAELRGDSTDTFWTWRDTMYRFALAMTPDDVAAVATLL